MDKNRGTKWSQRCKDKQQIWCHPPWNVNPSEGDEHAYNYNKM